MKHTVEEIRATISGISEELELLRTSPIFKGKRKKIKLLNRRLNNSFKKEKFRLNNL